MTAEVACGQIIKGFKFLRRTVVKFIFQEDNTGGIVGNGLEQRKTGGRVS